VVLQHQLLQQQQQPSDAAAAAGNKAAVESATEVATLTSEVFSNLVFIFLNI
jgi:hypothetical protein